MRHLKKGLSTFATLNKTDRNWVMSSLRGSVPAGEGTDDLAAFLAEKRKGTRRPVVFISHSHADKAFVRSLARQLRDRGIDVWLDEAELRVGDSLLDQLGESLDRVDFLLVVLSPASVKSSWVKEELKVALSRQIQKRRVDVIPLLKADCVIPVFLRDRLYADFTTPYRRKKNLPQLVESVMSHFRERRSR
ncbi:MAG: toll/interleukin-1 receptor domain-containing protein [Thermoanaerobaculia bacterium]